MINADKEVEPTSVGVARGFFLAIEGMDGSGKSALARAIAARLASSWSASVRLTFEPHDASCAGRYIRQVLRKEITPRTRQILPLAFAANRLDHCDRVIEPHLKSAENAVVVCDRYMMSSLVYQSESESDFGYIAALNSAAMVPDATLVVDVSPSVAYARLRSRSTARELFEHSLASVRVKYLGAATYLASRLGHNVITIDGDAEPKHVVESAMAALQPLFARSLTLQPTLFHQLPRPSDIGPSSLEAAPSRVEALVANSFRSNQLFSLDYSSGESAYPNELQSRVSDLLRATSLQSKAEWRHLAVEIFMRNGYRLHSTSSTDAALVFACDCPLPLGHIARGFVSIVEPSTDESWEVDDIQLLAANASRHDFHHVFVNTGTIYKSKETTSVVRSVVNRLGPVERSTIHTRASLAVELVMLVFSGSSTHTEFGPQVPSVAPTEVIASLKALSISVPDHVSHRIATDTDDTTLPF